MKTIYNKPECEELLYIEGGILCQSGSTEDFTYDNSDPRNNYVW